MLCKNVCNNLYTYIYIYIWIWVLVCHECFLVVDLRKEVVDVAKETLGKAYGGLGLLMREVNRPRLYKARGLGALSWVSVLDPHK